MKCVLLPDWKEGPGARRREATSGSALLGFVHLLRMIKLAYRCSVSKVS